MPNQNLTVVINAKDKASGILKKLKGNFGSLETAALTAGTAAAAFAAILIKQVITASVEFDKQLGNLQTLYGENTKSVGELEDGIKDLMKTSPTTANDLGAAAYQVVSAGIIDTADAIIVLNEANKLGVAGLGTTEEAVDITTSAINAFSLSSKDANQITNVFFKAVKNGKTTISELSQGFGQVAPLAASTGVEFEGLMAITSGLTTSGLKASTAYTQIRAVLSNLLKPTEEMQEAFDILGITSDNLKERISEEGLQGMLARLTETADENNIVTAKMFGSVEALNVVLALSGEVGEKTMAIQNNMTDSTDELSEAYKQQTERVGAQWQILKGQLMVVMLNMGEVVLPLINEGIGIMIDFIGRASEKWIAFKNAIQPAIDALKKVVDLLRKLKNLGGGGGSFLGTLGKSLLPGITPFANGGIVTSPTLGMVGEAGPEAVIPLSKMGGMGTTINIVVNGDVTGEDLIDRVGDALTQKLQLSTAVV